MCSACLFVHQVALGAGGLSGPFSAAAARVLSTLRGASDLLGGLLQLLLSDSAVDWSVDREAHAARKDQDTAVGLRLCASRCVSCGMHWKLHRENLWLREPTRGSLGKNAKPGNTTDTNHRQHAGFLYVLTDAVHAAACCCCCKHAATRPTPSTCSRCVCS